MKKIVMCTEKYFSEIETPKMADTPTFPVWFVVKQDCLGIFDCVEEIAFF